MKKKIFILNLNCGNISSVKNIFNFLDCNVSIKDNFDNLEEAEGLVIPGNGNFEHNSKEIDKRNKNKLLDLINVKKKPFLGICIGLQVLFESGNENDVNSNGLGLFNGNVGMLSNKEGFNDFSLPHIGWNEIKIYKNTPLLKDIPDNSSFYFLHSYACNDFNNKNCVAITSYGEKFISIAEKKNIVGLQFHPEKSHKNGIKILKNWINNYVKS